MRIQHNIMAMNAYRNYTNNTSAVAKNLEKLSSGYRINRAGDDAAGLAISEKMRAQITGLSAAQKNVKDGISLVKTAEGATQEIHDMLNRMVYLAEQSANGTYQDKVDREAITNEFEQLKSEINRIADSANFNGIKLLDGSLAGKAEVGQIEGGTVIDIDGTKANYEMKAAIADTAVKGKDTNRLDVTVSLTDADGNAIKEITVSLTGTTTAGEYLDANGKKVTGLADATKIGDYVKAELMKDKDVSKNFTITNTTGKLSFEAKEVGSDTMKISAINVTDVVLATGVGTAQNNGVNETVAGKDAFQVRDFSSLKIYTGANNNVLNDGTNKIDEATFTIDGKKFAFVSKAADNYEQVKAEMKEAGVEHFLEVEDDQWANATAAQFTEAAEKIAFETGLEVEAGDATTNAGVWDPTATAGKPHFKFTAGDSEDGGLMLQIGDDSESYNQLKVSIKDMHTKALGIDNIYLGSQGGAQAAVSKIKDAINYVSDVRGTLGATQNRLEHTQNNLSVMKENIQDAESSIRDTDVAEEMMAYTKNNILVQSAQAMLAQANQVPQGVLQLLG